MAVCRVTDKHGSTNISGLYVLGETACTGLHGANRLACNSLLACVVFARSAAKDILEKIDSTEKPKLADKFNKWQFVHPDKEMLAIVSDMRHQLRLLMWNDVGIVRTNQGLARAKQGVNLLKDKIKTYCDNSPVTKELLELCNLISVAELIVEAALARKENVGLHYNLDL